MLLLLLLVSMSDVKVETAGALIEVEEGHTIVPIRITHEVARLVKFEKTPQMIETFVDDAGDDLKIGTPHWEWYRNLEISKSGRVCTMELVSTSMPRQSASQVRVTGKLTFVSASGRETFRELISAREGEIGWVGNIEYEVRNVHPDRGSRTKTVQIMFYNMMPKDSPVIGTRYSYEDGSPIDEEQVKFQYHKRGRVIHLSLPRSATSFEVEIEQWLDHQIIEVPYDITARL